MLSRDDFIHALADGDLKIFPFDKKNLTGIGYNLSTTDFAFSVSRGILLTIHEETLSSGIRRYVTIPGNDTVLFFSKEYIEINSKLAGTFHSKVSRVSQGLGHISTTLDPTWKGQLLISINNPTDADIEFDLAKNGGNIMTLLLHKLDTPVTGENIHDNNKGRCELLIAHFAKPSSDPKHQEKHLELEHFVREELANSLNGTDNFTSVEAPEDEYSVQLNELYTLRERLKLDRKIIQEDRYVLGSEGKYYCLNPHEREFIERCALFKIKSQSIAPLHSGFCDGIEKSALASALPLLDACIDVIDYEINSIAHLRRIRWQNEMVRRFAGEDSELVALRKKSTEKKRRLVTWILPGLFVLFTAVLFSSLWRHGVLASTIGTLVVAIYAPISAVLLEYWIKALQKFKVGTN